MVLQYDDVEANTVDNNVQDEQPSTTSAVKMDLTEQDNEKASIVETVDLSLPNLDHKSCDIEVSIDDSDAQDEQTTTTTEVVKMNWTKQDEEEASIIKNIDHSSLSVTDHESRESGESDHCNEQPRKKWRNRLLTLILALAMTVLFLFSVLMIGTKVETGAVQRAPSTLLLYTNDTRVCAGNDTFQTFDSVNQVQNDTTIVHCGECSNQQDLKILATTRNTLTNDATTCAYRIFLGRSYVDNCLEEKVGFTPDCNDCWKDNIQCTFNAYLFTCLKTNLFGCNHNEGEEISDCLRCDEVMCGPAFLDCSGANRRLTGIVSDIAPDANREQCKEVTIDWAAAVPADRRQMQKAVEASISKI